MWKTLLLFFVTLGSLCSNPCSHQWHFSPNIFGLLVLNLGKSHKIKVKTHYLNMLRRELIALRQSALKASCLEDKLAVSISQNFAYPNFLVTVGAFVKQTPPIRFYHLSFSHGSPPIPPIRKFFFYTYRIPTKFCFLSNESDCDGCTTTA